jgi:hypothetical protein
VKNEPDFLGNEQPACIKPATGVDFIPVFCTFVQKNDMQATQILEHLLQTLDMSVREFALSLGYERAENFYNIQRGKSQFQYEALKEIVKTYPQINPDWLLDNSTQMLREKKEEVPQTEPAFMLTIRILEEQIRERDKRIADMEAGTGKAA